MNVTPAREEKIFRSGQQTGIEVSPGQSITIETSPAGREILRASPPVGKKWNVTCRIEIREIDI